MASSIGIRNRRSLLLMDLGDTYSIDYPSTPGSHSKRAASRINIIPSGFSTTITSLHFSMSSRLFQGLLIAGRFPLVLASEFGDEVTNNLITDLAPLLALFGERVAQQFMSQSMGVVDNIIFAVAPLGIVTAIVGAIRVGGPRSLRAIIGRAREKRAAVELELMSSTSADVCEVWDGSAVVRALGESPIIELIYLVPNASVRSENSPLLSRWEEDAGIYDFESAKRLPSGNRLLRKVGSSHVDHDHVQDLDSVSAPNISLNMAQFGSQLELSMVAGFGILLQSSVIVYAIVINFNFLPSLGSKLQKAEYPAIIYAPLMACGTVTLVVGMYLCSYIIERSTAEEYWEIKKIGGATVRVAWLQRGGVVGDELFNAYSLFPSFPTSPSWLRWITNQSRRINLGWVVHGLEKIQGMLKFLAVLLRHNIIILIGSVATRRIATPYRCIDKLFHIVILLRSNRHTGICLRTSRRDLAGNYHILTGVSVVMGLAGFLGQFVGLRGLHWSVTVSQLAATILMTVLRSWLRRNFVHQPEDHKLATGYELDSMTKTIKDCTTWSIVTWGIDLPLVTEDPHAAHILAARERLGALTRWPSRWQTAVNSTVEAIAATMNFLFSSPEITFQNKNDWSARDHFQWNMTVEFRAGCEAELRLGEICLSVKRTKLVDGAWGPWVVRHSEIEAVLGLWMLHFHNLDMPSRQNEAVEGVHENWQREGDTSYSTKRILRVVGLYNELAKMDYDRWILRQTHPVKIKNLDDFTKGNDRRCDYVIGNPTINNLYNLYPAAPVLGVMTDSRLESICGQSIYAGFMAKISEHVKIGGEVKIRWGNIGAKDSFGLVCPGLTTIAAIVQQAGLGNTEEAYMSIVPAFSRSGGLPIGPYGTQVLADIVEAANDLMQQQRQEDSGFFLLWLFNTAESVARVHKLGRKWQETAKLYSALRCACAQIKHPLAADYIDQADDSISRFCETVCNIERLDAASQGGSFESETSWMIELLGDVASATLAKWKQENPEGLLRLEIGTEDEQLCQAAEEGRGLRVERLLANGANIDCCDSQNDQQTPLILACIFGHATVAECLLLRGAKFTVQDCYGRTALHYAAQNGHTSIVQLLVQGDGSTVNTQDKKGQSSLDLAVAMNVGRVVDLLLFHGANDPNGQAKNLIREMRSPQAGPDGGSMGGGSGRQPLHWAAWIGSDRAMSDLLDNGVDIQQTDVLGRTALHIAAMNGSRSIVASLLTHPAITVNATDLEGKTPLHHAVAAGHEVIVQSLLDSGASMDAEDTNGQMPIHEAVIRGQHRTLRLLLEEGADREARFTNGGTLLHKAASEGHFPTARLLLNHQVHVDTRDKNDETPLHHAAREGHEAIVILLLDRGADIFAANCRGEHPLHSAASQGLKNIVELLLARGAIEVATDELGETIVHKANSAGDETTLRFLLDRHANLETVYPDGQSLLQKAASLGHHRVVGLLLEKGLDCETRSSSGPSLIWGAAADGHWETVQVLLDHGANKDIGDESLTAPIHVAAQNGHSRTVELLLAAGVEIETRNVSGYTALLCAASRGQIELVRLLLDCGARADTSTEFGIFLIHAAAVNGHTEMVEMLLDLGLSATVTDKAGQEPLHYAADSGYAEIVQLLLDHGGNPNLSSILGSMPLHDAVQNGHKEVIQTLLNHGVDINAKNGLWMVANRKTPIQIAREKGRPEIVQLLLDRGAIE